MKFSELNLSAKVLRALEQSGYKNATEVQQKAIPSIINGKDVVVRSQTGSGKTMAYVLPIVESIDYSINTVQALIVCPTRELALQVANETTKITTVVGDVRVVTVYGGSDIGRQIKALKRKPQIVIGTPGRLMDHMDRKTLKLYDLKTVVLDEADEMLNMGFKDDIEKILKTTPKTRQTLLFSATYPNSIKQITKNYQKNAEKIEIGSENTSLENIKQFYVMADRRNKKQTFVNLFKMIKAKNAIIFCNTKKMVEELDNILRKEGFNSSALHGDLRQSQRRKVMSEMKNGRSNILVASDVVARGIDIDNIDYVFNYDLPNNVEYFLHRIGRTARAGKKGSAITIVNTRQQFSLLKEFEKETESDIQEIEVKVHSSSGDNKKADFSKDRESRSFGGKGFSKGGSNRKGNNKNSQKNNSGLAKKRTNKKFSNKKYSDEKRFENNKAGKGRKQQFSQNSTKNTKKHSKNMQFGNKTVVKREESEFLGVGVKGKGRKKNSEKSFNNKRKTSGRKSFNSKKTTGKGKGGNKGSKYIPTKR